MKSKKRKKIGLSQIFVLEKTIFIILISNFFGEGGVLSLRYIYVFEISIISIFYVQYDLFQEMNKIHLADKKNE